MVKLHKDLIAYLLLISFLAVPVLLWQTMTGGFTWSSGSAISRSIGQVSGILGASLFSLNFILAARLRWLEELMSGLPRVYNAHHIIGGLALILVLAHPLFLSLQYLPASLPLAAAIFSPNPKDLPKLMGQLALYVMAGLLIITFFARIAYQKWKASHQWLGLALLLASLHVYLIPGNLSSAPLLRAYMLIVIGLGLLAFMYRVLFGRWLVRRHPYEVRDIKVNSDNGTEVSLSPLSKPLQYYAGQFFFIRVLNAAGVTREPHPFSFTSAPAQPDISFAAKPLGDYTTTLKLLTPGIRVDVEGPYGRFIFAQGGDKQVWIAGGIGITPFMSRAREIGGNTSQKIVLYYLVRNRKDAIFIDELQTIAGRNTSFKLIVWQSDTKGRFTMEHVTGLKLSEYTFFICGPMPMMAALKRAMRQLNINREKIFAEEFKLY